MLIFSLVIFNLDYLYKIKTKICLFHSHNKPITVGLQDFCQHSQCIAVSNYKQPSFFIHSAICNGKKHDNHKLYVSWVLLVFTNVVFNNMFVNQMLSKTSKILGMYLGVFSYIFLN